MHKNLYNALKGRVTMINDNRSLLTKHVTINMLIALQLKQPN